MNINGNWLLLDTAGARGVVGISIDEIIVAEFFLSEQKSHAERLSEAITSCLKEANLKMTELSGIAVGRGPGSFVGTRVAIAHAKGIALGLGIPLVGVGTLAAIGQSTELPSGNGLVVIDARRNEFFVLNITIPHNPLLLGEGRVQAPHTIPQDQLRDLLDNIDFIIGNGLSVAAGCTIPFFRLDGPSAAGLLAALKSRLLVEEVTDELLSLAPDYCRLPDAKPNMPAK